MCVCVCVCVCVLGVCGCVCVGVYFHAFVNNVLIFLPLTFSNLKITELKSYYNV